MLSHLLLVTGGTMNTSVRKDSPVNKASTQDLDNLTQVIGSATGFLGELTVLSVLMIVKILPGLSGCVGCTGCNFFG